MPVFGVRRKTAKNTPVSARAFRGISSIPRPRNVVKGQKSSARAIVSAIDPAKVLSAIDALRPSGEVMTVFRVPTNA